MANITKVYLLSVPLEPDYAHTLYFGTTAAQQTYFQSKVKKSYTDFSYQRKDGVIRIPEHIDALHEAGCNYVMYQNSAYSDKWFYAFITKMEYINDGRTDITIKTDSIQTWKFDITIHPSFVEREHAASDDIGEHTIDEGLELGEFVANNRFELNYGDGLAVVVGVTKTPEGLINAGGQVHGIYSGIMYYALENALSGSSVNDFLAQYDADGVGDAVQCMFLAPKALVADSDGTVTYGTNVPNIGTPHRTIINKPDSGWVGYDEEVANQFVGSVIDNYTPRNKKLLSFPYRYLLVSNNAGGSAVYKYERFYIPADDGSKTIIEPSFAINGCLTPGCSVRLHPCYYNGIQHNLEEGLNMGKFPILNWTSDIYTNWLTQNSVNIAINLASGVGQIAAGAAIAVGSAGLGTAVGGGTVVGGVSTIANTLGQIHQQSFNPPQARGNLNSGDVVTAMNDNTFQFYGMSIKKELAQVIDEYFDMYGYKCHRVKIPNLGHREEYWYTKTVDANITGDIPQEDLQTIKDCYNRGITFWYNSTNFRDYSVENAIAEG